MTSCQSNSVDFKTDCHFFEKCGGCDFLNLPAAKYQDLKKGILEKELSGNLASSIDSIDYFWVGPHSRRKITLQVNNKNQVGFFAKKTNDVVEIDSCFIAEEKISALIIPLKKFIKSQEGNLFTQISITLFEGSIDVILHAKRELNFAQSQKALSFAKEHNLNISCKIKNQLTPIFLPYKNQIIYTSESENFKVDLKSEIFIQATKIGLNKIVEEIRNFLLKNKNIKNIADIYSGFGAYAFAICDLSSVISAFEGSAEMTEMTSKNAAANDLSNKIKAFTKDLFSDPITKKELEKFDLAIINPPRNGATPQITEISKSKIKNVIYVSCNPRTFAFDAKILIDAGFKIEKLLALDQFHASIHLELIAIFKKI